MVAGVNFKNYQDPITVQRQVEAMVNNPNFNLNNSYITPIQLTMPQPTDSTQQGTNNGTVITADTFTLANSSVAPYTITTAAQGNEQAGECTDEKDDGKIGFWSAAGNVLKGVGKFFWSAVSDEKGNFSLWQTIKTAAIGTAIALIPGAAPIALAVGGVLGAAGTAKSIYDIATAKTDAEDKLAWQSFGSSATALGLSLFGARQYARSTNPNASITDGVKQTFTDAKNNIVSIKDIRMADVRTALGNGKALTAEAFENITGVKYSDYQAMSPSRQAALRRLVMSHIKSDISSTVQSNIASVRGQSLRQNLTNAGTHLRNAGNYTIEQLKNPAVDATLVLASDQTPQFYA